MPDERRNFFGTNAQQALLRRGRDLYQSLADDPRFSYYGRTVGISSLTHAPFDELVRLARLQGNSSCGLVPADLAQELSTQAESIGLSPHFYARWNSVPGCLEDARTSVAKKAMPDGLTLHVLSAQTSGTLRASLAELTSGKGVLLPNTAVLIGDLKPGVCVFAADPAGAVVSCAAAASYVNVEPSSGNSAAWWGMLATRDDYTGRGLAAHLGAKAIVLMADRFGYNDFFTGVTPGNVPSEAVCKRMSFANSGDLILAVADPNLLPGGRMTK